MGWILAAVGIHFTLHAIFRAVPFRQRSASLASGARRGGKSRRADSTASQRATLSCPKADAEIRYRRTFISVLFEALRAVLRVALCSLFEVSLFSSKLFELIRVVFIFVVVILVRPTHAQQGASTGLKGLSPRGQTCARSPY